MSRRYVLLVGDSHLVGVGDPTGLGWAGRVLERCRGRGLDLTSTRLGQPDDTSRDLVNRWTDWLPAKREHEGDTRVILAFGVNDAAEQDRPAEAARRRSRKLLGVLLDEMTAAGLSVFCVGPAPVSDPEHRHRIEQLSIEFAPVCEERQVPYADVFGGLLTSEAWFAELDRHDGVHPGAGGYEAFAGLVARAGLVDWLRHPMPPAQGLPHRRERRFEPGRAGQRSRPHPANGRV